MQRSFTRLKTQDSRPGASLSYNLRLASYVLCLPLFFLYGCSMISPPADYYQEVLEMEEYGEQVRRDTGRRPGEIVTPVEGSEPVRVAESPVYQSALDAPQQQAEATSIAEQEEIQEEPEKPPRREIVRESSSSPRGLKRLGWKVKNYGGK